VLEVASDRALVFYGTTKAQQRKGKLVQPRESFGMALGLSAPTGFYLKNIRWVSLPLLRSLGKRCPPSLFLELRALAEESLELMTEGELLQGLPPGQ
jgi:hypothetical protein